jgi:hypothetical protein
MEEATGVAALFAEVDLTAITTGIVAVGGGVIGVALLIVGVKKALQMLRGA